jgi:hypothetical protein
MPMAEYKKVFIQIDKFHSFGLIRLIQTIRPKISQ